MFKFLDPSLCTYYDGVTTYYGDAIPRNGEKWGEWMQHPEPAEADGYDCEPGSYHAMKHLDARYAPKNWYPWWLEGEGLVGESQHKARFHCIRLRRIAPRTYWRMLRLGWSANCDLHGADLRGANLREADLREAGLEGANLSGANLHEANLCGANLRGANLRGANLHEANLEGADLCGADLHGANLREADLRGANLEGANLIWADLEGANLEGANLEGADLRGAKLRGADLRGAKLREAGHNKYTTWPEGFKSEEATSD